MTDETKSKKLKYDFPCKTKINANSYCKKDVKTSVKIEVKWLKKIDESKREKQLLSIKIELDLYRTKKRPFRNLKNQSLIILSIN